MKKDNSKIFYDNISFRILSVYVLIGIACGLIIGLFKRAIGLVSDFMKGFIVKAHDNILLSLGVIILLVLIGTLIYYLAKRNSNIEGSGIPIIYGMLDNKIEVSSSRTLMEKFVTSTLAIGSGLTLGREGPSVQIGGLIGDIGHKLSKSKEDRANFIGAAAGAGIAVAFNAPLAGILFTVEEIFHKTDRKTFLASSITIFSSILVSNFFFGNLPALKSLPLIKDIEPSMIIYIMLLGVLCGLSGVLFNKLVIGSKAIYKKIKINPYIKYISIFVITGIVLIMDINLFASGEEFIYLPIGENKSISQLVILYVVKILLLCLAFGGSIPGGSLVPLIVLGSILGNAFGVLLNNLGIIDSSSILLFAMLAMGGHFSAIVRAPITAVILVFEMSGGIFNYLLYLAVVSLIAYLVAEVFKSKPFYTHLYELMVEK
ncbi:MAG: ClC family H(+)/Cl(-) exchange transporter [Anaerococcus sp.]|nr:ClC family H(+)/Cl(-) exchange transporter [Anaerococcus sp.]MDD7045449.1 ClC family H(+)/Cl(-) exchange transporter [Peptoniphilaceae bacterium]MDY2919010.1 ClC family H(+)/Cl(-) exchange transporter [Anaerococcus sp.]